MLGIRGVELVLVREVVRLSASSLGLLASPVSIPLTEVSSLSQDNKKGWVVTLLTYTHNSIVVGTSSPFYGTAITENGKRKTEKRYV